MVIIQNVQGGQKSKLLHFDYIFTKYWLNIEHFSQLFISRLCKKFATQWHAHHTYCVTTLPCKTWNPKTSNFYRSAERSNGNFLKYLTEMLNMSYGKRKEKWRTYWICYWITWTVFCLNLLMYINAGWQLQFYSLYCMSIVFRSCGPTSCALFC